MSPHPIAWPNPMMSAPQFWPSEPPAGLGPWGRQTEHRLAASEHQLASGGMIIDKLQEIEDRLAKLEAAPKPEVPRSTLVDLVSNQNFRLLLWLAIAGLTFVATGKMPDLTSLLGK
jgi:hypothetical protein